MYVNTHIPIYFETLIKIPFIFLWICIEVSLERTFEFNLSFNYAIAYDSEVYLFAHSLFLWHTHWIMSLAPKKTTDSLLYPWAFCLSKTTLKFADSVAILNIFFLSLISVPLQFYALHFSMHSPLQRFHIKLSYIRLVSSNLHLYCQLTVWWVLNVWCVYLCGWVWCMHVWKCRVAPPIVSYCFSCYWLWPCPLLAWILWKAGQRELIECLLQLYTLI